MIQLQNATFGYRGHAVIHCPQLSILTGKCVGIYGANGSGKSTLLRGIAGILRPMSGTIERHQPVTISLVPQRQAIDPMWPMTALDAAALALSTKTRFGWLHGQIKAVRESMDRLRVGNLANRPFAELSGGQQQRILLAGALACKPALLLLDEPAEGLDAQSTTELITTLKNLVTAGTALVMISHEAGELAHVADTFAWVEVAGTTQKPNELTNLSREEFLLRAVGNAPRPLVGASS